jgi:sugar transferase (PEP-CTERM system associated)
MRVFGHYVLRSRVRLFLAEQAAVSVLFLAAIVISGTSGPKALVLAACCALLIQLPLYLADLYEPAEMFPEARWLVAAGIGSLFVTFLWQKIGPGASGELLAASLLSLLIVVMLREIALTRPRRAIVLGSGGTARAVGSIRESLVDCSIIGYLAGTETEGTGPTPTPVLLDRGDVDAVAERMGADLIVVAVEGPLPDEALARARSSGIEVVSAAGFASRYARRIPVELLAPSELAFGEGFAAARFADLLQRVLDICASVTLLILAGPVLLVAMLAVRLDSPGPVFYHQERVGRRGRTYLITKLRSMRSDAESNGLPVWAATNDSRVTRIGRFLRKTRIDELPQVFAVLRGDMSIVGPRPERPFFVEQLKASIPLYGLREIVKPGVTGWAQIRYPYGSTVEDAKRKLEYDLYYIRHRSFFLNLTILFHTARTVLTGRGAR